MATHSSILAWRIPQTEEPGGLQSIGLQRVGHDWSDLSTHRWEREIDRMYHWEKVRETTENEKNNKMFITDTDMTRSV